MRSTIREDIQDFADLRKKNMPFAASAYTHLMTWKLNEAQGLSKNAYYNYDAKEENK